MEHINELCTQYKVQTPNILTNIVPEIPSWIYPPIRICPFLETKNQGLLDEEMRAIFLAHQERHPTVHIYTDGSKSTEGVGFAAMFPNTTSGGRLTGEASIFTTELYAINAAPTAPHKAIPHTDMRRPLREATTNGWHRKWNSLAREGRKPREIKKDVKDWTSSHNKSRRIETVLARLRLGHTNITHVYIMQGQTEPPECDRCRVTITVKHLLLECRKYVTIRNKYFRNPTLSDMLAESSDVSVDKLVLYLKETNLFHQI